MYIAIDGGGTKTEILLLDGGFRQIDRITCGCVNHERLKDGYDEAGRALRDALGELLGRNGTEPHRICDLVAGIAGVDTPEDGQAYALRLECQGFSRALICNDGYLPVKANAPEGWGIAYNCGTGVCCNAVGPRGEMTKTGGLDEWAGDAGGGRWIGQRVFRAVYDRYVLGLRETLLEEMYISAFGIRDEAELVDSLMRLKREPERERKVIRMLFEAEETGDGAARDIAEEMRERAVRYIRAALNRTAMGEGEVPVILTGSVLLKAAGDAYLAALESRIRSEVPQARIIRAKNAPVQGAVKWLKERNGT